MNNSIEQVFTNDSPPLFPTPEPADSAVTETVDPEAIIQQMPNPIPPLPIN